MCGIAGQLLFFKSSVDAKILDEMSSLLAHRGPDGAGFYIDQNIGLTHRRLAIIDLSEEGSQPMKNENSTLWLVFNGEIYNYIELMQELSSLGHIFRSKTDSEVIIHAYEEWGYECLQKFNGMWAFALWDANKKHLFCARDRLGIKPFYYTFANNSFIFASEIKALRVYPDVGRTPNNKLILEFLSWGMADHTEETMFEGIKQLLPGHYIIVDEQGVTQRATYWKVAFNREFKSNRELNKKAPQDFLKLIEDSITLHLRSDVPVGTCLSGGLDSSTITAIINKQLLNLENKSSRNIQNTFSACFTDDKFDESNYINAILKETKVESHKTYPDTTNIWSDLNHLLYINDEPFAALTIYSQYCVMRKAKDSVKVVLDGQGADELLGGYIGYHLCHLRGIFQRMKFILLTRELLGIFRHHRNFIIFAIRELYTRRKTRKLIRDSITNNKRYQGNLSDALEADLFHLNLPYLLHWEDRTSMAFSIEARVPFLDYRLIEFLARLPEDQKIRYGITKYILRSAIRGIVPDFIRCRMDKKGFSTPEENWMREGMRDGVSEILKSTLFHQRPYWDPNAVQQYYNDYLQGKVAYSSEIWRIVCTELWLRMFIDS